ncbi:GltB/FmdC/FwdC-like GXGXG domain-containing protein [Pseudonocardia bannensis]|uniref:Glutamate synthase n=1 Tax=Pseudonocardia bannensis TaxID=630973 RepID=A0A848DEF8_9PSEU|nr:glutamate synthase [Pseudonocardia bannensis]NMH90992.1 glutamate synthase [Pseudonocardia bannensis]
MDQVTLNCAELTTREVNAALAALPDGSRARILEPWGRHNLAVGLVNRITVEIEGNAGYFIGGLGDGPDVVVDGFVGWSAGENLMSGTVRVRGNASECTGASAHGGAVIVEGDASSRAGISLKGGTVLVGGDVGHMSGFMAQAGVMLVGGDAGHALGDSLYETVIYVAGSIASLGSDARAEDLTDDDVLTVKQLAALAGFDHIDPENVTRVASARQLYNFDALKDQRY